jgi:hypothetical protein
MDSSISLPRETVRDHSMTELFLDFEIEGRRIIVAPSWLNLRYAGVPLPPEKCPSIPPLDTLPSLYTSCTVEEQPAALLIEYLRESLAHAKTP